MMNQHMSGPSLVGGPHMNGATSPVTTPTSAGGMMANGLQSMGGVVTTYPPRRKAIRAAQVRFIIFIIVEIACHYRSRLDCARVVKLR